MNTFRLASSKTGYRYGTILIKREFRWEKTSTAIFYPIRYAIYSLPITPTLAIIAGMSGCIYLWHPS